jgi:hypothetical protein
VQKTLASTISSTAFVFVGAAAAVLVLLQLIGSSWQGTEDAHILAGVVAALSGHGAWVMLTRPENALLPFVVTWLTLCKIVGIAALVGYAAAWALL